MVSTSSSVVRTAIWRSQLRVDQQKSSEGDQIRRTKPDGSSAYSPVDSTASLDCSSSTDTASVEAQRISNPSNLHPLSPSFQIVSPPLS